LEDRSYKGGESKERMMPGIMRRTMRIIHGIAVLVLVSGCLSAAVNPDSYTSSHLAHGVGSTGESCRRLVLRGGVDKETESIPPAAPVGAPRMNIPAGAPAVYAPAQMPAVPPPSKVAASKPTVITSKVCGM
jgi:hypothetical protein